LQGLSSYQTTHLGSIPRTSRARSNLDCATAVVTGTIDAIMKDQYVGDISDFGKYAILRALAAEADLPLAVCWMLTAPDETGEGGRIDFLKQPEGYRHLEPHVFDRLAAIVKAASGT
jgi:hypothetical protein